MGDVLDTDTVNGVPIARLCERCRPRVKEALRGGPAEGTFELCVSCVQLVLGKPIYFQDGVVEPPVDHEAAIEWQVDQMRANQEAAGNALPPVTAPAHPAPWKWSPMQLALVDANGKDVIAAPCGPCADLVSIDGSAGDLELLRAAPEMADLLKRLVDLSSDGDAVRDNVGWICDITDEAKALLARLDDARKAGG